MRNGGRCTLPHLSACVEAEERTQALGRWGRWVNPAQRIVGIAGDTQPRQIRLDHVLVIAEMADEDTPEQAHGRADRAQSVRNGLRQLPERQREALVLCHFQGLSNIEAAALLELSVDALESLLARARKGLRAALDGQGLAPGAAT